MIRPLLLAAAAFVAAHIAANPAYAGEASGKIQSVDDQQETLTLDSGQTFKLPGEFDYSALQVGMQVVVVYDETGDGNMVTDIELAE